MNGPVKCPLCDGIEIEPVLDKIRVMATYDDFNGPIGALIVLRCKQEGHIFFIREADIQAVAA